MTCRMYSSLSGGTIRKIGEPPRSVYFTDYDFVYRLGPERSFFSIDSEWLVIKLDSIGRVSEARLATD